MANVYPEQPNQGGGGNVPGPRKSRNRKPKGGIGKPKFHRKKGGGGGGGGDHNRTPQQRQRRRLRRALGNWSAVSEGPMPPVIRRAFMQDAQRTAAAFSRPRQRAIDEYTGALADQLAPIAGRIGGYYGAATQGTAASEGALAQMLSGQGQQLAGDLAQQLGAAGQDISGLGTAGIGEGSAAASYALGSANIGRLLAQGAAAQGQAAQLPGIARLGGLQHTRELQGMAQAQAQEAFQKSLDRELEKWISRTGLGMQRKGLKEEKKQFRKGLKEEKRQFNVSVAEDRRRWEAEYAKSTAGEQEELSDDRADAWRSVRPDARELANRLFERREEYGVAMTRMTNYLFREMEGMWSRDRAKREARRMLAYQGYRDTEGGHPQGPGRGGGGGGGSTGGGPPGGA